mgnify:CR=1 FL=1|tara:strand:- start:15 stop:314 length:300 start_codon:yes stop_codon:yes gene_type:complete
MSIILTIEYKAQVIVELTSEAIQNKKAEEAFEQFDRDLANLLVKDFYKEVKIDSEYKRYGLDVGLVSENKKKLADACHDLAFRIQNNPNLKDIYFEDFE